jgi:hypothetical protein
VRRHRSNAAKKISEYSKFRHSPGTATGETGSE